MLNFALEAFHNIGACCLKFLPITLRPHCVYGLAQRASPSFYPERFHKSVKVTLYISMSPQNEMMTRATLPGSLPPVFLSFCSDLLDIYPAVHYHDCIVSLAG